MLVKTRKFRIGALEEKVVVLPYNGDVSTGARDLVTMLLYGVASGPLREVFGVLAANVGVREEDLLRALHRAGYVLGSNGLDDYEPGWVSVDDEVEL